MCINSVMPALGSRHCCIFFSAIPQRTLLRGLMYFLHFEIPEIPRIDLQPVDFTFFIS